MNKPKRPKRKRPGTRQRNTAKYRITEGTTIDYKNVSLLQKYLNERGKILPRRITGVTAHQQRQLSSAIKQARFLALLTTGGVK